VCFSKVRDAQTFLTGNLDVGVDVALRVDHNTLTCLLAAHHVGCMRKAWFVDLLEKHITSFEIDLLRSMRTYGI
jgi:hypothetical protein